MFLRFSLVGIVGFAVDAGVLMLVAPWLGPYWGRLISFILAVLATWVLNRHYTFEPSAEKLTLPSELRRYFSAMIVGGTANYGVFAALVYFSENVAKYPVIGVGVGSIVGLTINFTLAKNWIFKPKD